MLLPTFAPGPWLETTTASFYWTTPRASPKVNKRRRQINPANVFLNFTYLHKMEPGQKLLAIISQNFLEEIYFPDVGYI